MSITLENLKKLRNVLLVIISLYLMLGAALYSFEERLLFHPTELDTSYIYEFDSDFEELNFQPEPEVVINALHFKIKNPKGIILYSHGNAGDLSRWGRIASAFTSYGYEVLVWDYRTYGKSKGKLSEAAINSDAQCVYDYVNSIYPAESIVLYGRSLGTGVSSYLASHNPSQQLILETPFYSITDVAKYRFPIFPVERLMRYKFPTYAYLAKVKCPITVIHGTEDRVVPYESAQKLKVLGLNNLRLVTVPGGAHNNLVDFALFHDAITKCLN